MQTMVTCGPATQHRQPTHPTVGSLLRRRTPVTAAATVPAPPPVARLGAGAPDHRAIVRQGGPAVVGLTVEGTHVAEAGMQGDLPPGVENDPFFQFFRGMRAGPATGGGSGRIVEDGKLGLALRALSDAERRASEAIGVGQGLVIEQVAGAARAAGVEAGDVLLAVNGRRVGSVDPLRSAVAGAPKQVALLLLRDGHRIFVPLRLG